MITRNVRSMLCHSLYTVVRWLRSLTMPYVKQARIKMKIELTGKEICILFFCVKELANRCRESKYTVKYPQSNIKVYEDLAKKLEDSLK